MLDAFIKARLHGTHRTVAGALGLTGKCQQEHSEGYE